ncbi:MAG: DeoR/GlpR family DNA-binding transcription regulator [Lachnospiraceae bacterium]|nr:DeoR/GlpR family DNA-binding transcription regulator [Lachnospiraceae bacterium]
MDSMDERRNAIVDFVNAKGDVSFAQLKEVFSGVSEMTLRTDLKKLDEEKRIVRVHGGAKSVDIVLGTDDLMGRRAIRNVEAKQEIVEKVLKLIRPNTTIFLDSGSTTTMLAENWPDQPNFIFTSSLTCAMALSKLKQPKIFMPGGELNIYSLSTCGMEAMETLKRVSFDMGILGVTSYDGGFGFSCGVLMESYLKQQVLEQSSQKIVLMDTSKLGKKSTFHICGLDAVDIVAAENNIDPAFIKECEESGVELI